MLLLKHTYKIILPMYLSHLCINVRVANILEMKIHAASWIFLSQCNPLPGGGELSASVTFDKCITNRPNTMLIITD